MDYLIVLERTILFYIIITVLYRFMGKREVGQLGIVDLIVSILIAELAAISIDNRTESIFLSIIPIVVLVLIQMGMAYYSLKNQKVSYHSHWKKRRIFLQNSEKIKAIRSYVDFPWKQSICWKIPGQNAKRKILI